MPQMLKHTSAHSLLSVVINSLVHKGALLYRDNPCMCDLRGRQPGPLNVRAVLRHDLPNKGLHPLRRFAAIPAHFVAGTICFQQTVLAAKSENPILSVRPSTENVGGLFYPIHPIHHIKKEVIHYGKTENHPRTENRDC